MKTIRTISRLFLLCVHRCVCVCTYACFVCFSSSSNSLCVSLCFCLYDRTAFNFCSFVLFTLFGVLCMWVYVCVCVCVCVFILKRCREYHKDTNNSFTVISKQTNEPTPNEISFSLSSVHSQSYDKKL